MILDLFALPSSSLLLFYSSSLVSVSIYFACSTLVKSVVLLISIIAITGIVALLSMTIYGS
ncbi:hypothetical protein BDF19DRAFT_58049 [Syncephalis fuscata]|nr:hypothetical protein BDF19DRAFT_58049 [Syncephalis fuscata]